MAQELQTLSFSDSLDKLTTFTNELRSDLKISACEITFEKVDGTVRVLKGTLRPDLLPKEDPAKAKDTKRKTPDGVISVWDLEVQGWRSIREQSIYHYKVLDNA